MLLNDITFCEDKEVIKTHSWLKLQLTLALQNLFKNFIIHFNLVLFTILYLLYE